VTLADSVTLRDEALNETRFEGAAVDVEAEPMVKTPPPLLATKFPPPE
jgi:hypothetical protein